MEPGAGNNDKYLLNSRITAGTSGGRGGGGVNKWLMVLGYQPGGATMMMQPSAFELPVHTLYNQGLGKSCSDKLHFIEKVK
jgi:hypothetical protein